MHIFSFKYFVYNSSFKRFFFSSRSTSLIAKESSLRSMGKQVDNKFTWVIKNFSSLKTDKIYSDQFIIGRCNWHLYVNITKNNNGDNLSLYLEVPDSKSLLPGWGRHAKVSFTLVNQRLEKLSKKLEFQKWFDQKSHSAWGYENMITLNDVNAKDSGFLVNGEVKIVAEIDVLEVIGKIYVNGFHLPPSQVEFVSLMFERHPEIASNFRPKNTNLKTGYMTLLLSLIDTLRQSPHELPDHDLDEACVALSSLSGVGFKLDWLETRLDQVSEKKEKGKASENRMQEIENHLKDLKQKCSDLEAQLEKEKAVVVDAKASLSFDDFM